MRPTYHLTMKRFLIPFLALTLCSPAQAAGWGTLFRAVAKVAPKHLPQEQLDFVQRTGARLCSYSEEYLKDVAANDALGERLGEEIFKAEMAVTDRFEVYRDLGKYEGEDAVSDEFRNITQKLCPAKARILRGE